MPKPFPRLNATGFIKFCLFIFFSLLIRKLQGPAGLHPTSVSDPKATARPFGLGKMQRSGGCACLELLGLRPQDLRPKQNTPGGLCGDVKSSGECAIILRMGPTSSRPLPQPHSMQGSRPGRSHIRREDSGTLIVHSERVL